MRRNRQIILVPVLLVFLLILLGFLLSKLYPRPIPVPTGFPTSIETSPSVFPFIHTPFIAGSANPLFQIQDRGMTACKQAIEKQACPPEFLSTFLSAQSDNICVGWTELGRKPSDGISVYVYNQSNARVFAYTEETRPEKEREYRQCKLVPVNQILPSGAYHTEFSIGGRPFGEPIPWTITCPNPPAGWVSYDVQSGDTLETIRTWYSELTFEMFMQANCLPVTTIFPGQKLYVPRTPPPGKIIGIVFADPNDNRAQEGGEQRVSGITLPITDSHGNFVRTIVTDGNGRFEVELPAGTYFVLQVQVSLHPKDEIHQNFAVVPVPP